MIKILLLVMSAYLFWHSNLPGMVFDKLNDMDTDSYTKKNDVSKFESKNDFGDNVLDVSSLPSDQQIDIWEKSKTKEEFSELFPNFSDLRDFAKNRILGESLKKRILTKISKVEDDFISGGIDTETAKKTLTTIE